MKQYVGLVRDHSGSVRTIAPAMLKDYNATIDALRESADEKGIDTILNVVAMRQTNDIRREVLNSSIRAVKPLTSYTADGWDTPLFDAVLDLIQIMEQSSPDKNNKDVAFLVIVTTDGENNAGSTSGNDLAKKIQALQNTDRWTITFRVPRGGTATLTKRGIPADNIIEWEQSTRGVEEVTRATKAAVSNYYGIRGQGFTKSTNFYANLGGVTAKQVERTIPEISHQVREFAVTARYPIQDFIEHVTGKAYVKGTAFYQLSKSEKAVQSHKNFIVRHKFSGKLYGGQDARKLLGIPDNDTISLKPGDHGDWDIFIQSTSSNRILLPGTDVVLWTKAVGY